MAEVLPIRDLANKVSATGSPGIIVSWTTRFADWLGLLLGAGLALTGCAPVGVASAGPSPAQVTVAPGIVFSLPSPKTLERSVEAQQLITARYRDTTFVFETRISVTSARLLVAGTDMLGRRAMTIEWTGSDLHADVAPWMPAELRARNIVADIMLLHWPAQVVRAGLAPTDSVQESSPGHRVILAEGRDMIRIDQTAGAPGSWSGRWRYRNVGWGYELDIQSSEVAP